MSRAYPEEPEETGPGLEPDTVELLARRIVQLLAQHLTSPPSAGPPAGRLLTAAQVSAWWGVSRGWVYEHATQLGAVRIGEGERPRLRFDPDRVAEHLNQPPAGPPPTPNPAPPMRRRSPGIPRDPKRLAYRPDPELSSPGSTRRPGDAPPSPATEPKTAAFARWSAYPQTRG